VPETRSGRIHSRDPEASGRHARVIYRLLATLARLLAWSGRAKDLEIIVLRHQIDRPALTEADAAVSGVEASRTGSSSCNCVEDAQPGSLPALREIGLISANMLRAFQVGKARTSHEGPWSWMRRSRVAAAQVSWPACHLTKASASAVI